MCFRYSGIGKRTCRSKTLNFEGLESNGTKKSPKACVASQPKKAKNYTGIAMINSVPLPITELQLNFPP